MDRRLDPAGLMASPTQLIDLGTTWSDYDGNDAYGEFTLSGATATTQAYYEPGLWRNTKVGPNFVPLYLHNDHLGTLRRTTTAIGAATNGSRVFTAFGEKLAAPTDRFAYVGAFGYQQHAEMPVLHVGHRYYDPASGRFLQRDPIGIQGGQNVFAYSRHLPSWLIDPSGLTIVDDIGAGAAVGGAVGGTVGGAVGGAVGVPIPGAPIPPGAPGAAAGAMGGSAVGATIGAMCGLFHWLGERIADLWGPGAEHDGYDDINNPKPPIPDTGWCFVAGTVVALDQFSTPVEWLSVGDGVLSASDGDIPGLSMVVEIHESSARELVLIDLEGERLECTPEHPFWVVHRGWVRASALAPGDVLWSADGTGVPVIAVTGRCAAHSITVYNVTVGGSHTYYVGERKVKVHNKVH
jgi:RHS repeat-associated protein